MKTSRLVQTTLVSLFAFLLLSGAVLADKATAMKRRKAAQVDKYKEVMEMEWPAIDKWKSDNLHQNGQNSIEFFYPEGQSSQSWREMGTIEINAIDKTVSLTGKARSIFLGTQQASPHAEWKILYKGNSENGYRYIVFQITCPDFLSGEQPQLQYWKMIQGDQKLFTIQYTYKDEVMPEDKQLRVLEAIDGAHVVMIELEPKEEKEDTEDKE